MNQSEQNLHWHSYNRFLRRKEAEFAPKIYKALQQQIQTFIDSGITNTNIEFIDSAPIAEVIKNLYTSTGTLWAHQAYLSVRRLAGIKARSPIGFNEDIINQILQYFQLRLLNEAVAPITDTTKEWIRTVLSRNILVGNGIDDIVDEILNADITKVRARLIARTEVMKAANVSEQFGVDKTGLQTNKIWISALDNRTRRDHLTVNGQTVPDGGNFTVGVEKFLMDGPGDGSSADGRKVPAKEICNCRCVKGRKVLRGTNGVPLKKSLTDKPVLPYRVPGLKIRLF